MTSSERLRLVPRDAVGPEQEDAEPLSARGAARERLLDAAEQLFGQYGIEGVSLREIAAAAGQRNTGAVHYYFRDRQGLVDALLVDRAGKVEKLRQALVDSAGDLRSGDTASLLRMMWQPWLDLCARRGENWLVQFHLSNHLRNTTPEHPIVADPQHHPASAQLLEALRAQCRHLPHEQFHYRLGLMFMMFWAAVSRHQSSEASGAQAATNRFSLDESIKVAVAALAAPH